MKRIIYLMLLVFAACLLSSCGSDSENSTANNTEDILLSTTWISVNDGDEYVFSEDGKGTHDDIEISYKIEGSSVQIMEGVASAESSSFLLDSDSDPKRLTPENGKTYYVPSEDYEESGKKVREENIRTLTSPEAWKSTNTTAYLMFSGSTDGKSGSGWTLLTGTTIQMSWEMIDNNTVKTTLSYNGVERTSTLDIIVKDGQASLIDTSSGQILWTPKK